MVAVTSAADSRAPEAAATATASLSKSRTSTAMPGSPRTPRRRPVSAVTGLAAALTRSLRQAAVWKSSDCSTVTGEPASSPANAAPTVPRGTVSRSPHMYTTLSGASRCAEM
jgi:hypothetical protein